jgi:hypothetical protein
LVRAVYNPIFAVIGAVYLVIRAFKEWNATMDDLADKLAQPIGNLGDAVKKIHDETLAANKDFTAGQETLQKNTDAAIKLIESEKQALDKLLEVQEKLALAMAKTEGDKAAIKERFEGRKKDVDVAAQQAVIFEKIKQTNAEQQKLNEEEAKTKGFAEPGVRARLSDYDKARADLMTGKGGIAEMRKLLPTPQQLALVSEDATIKSYSPERRAELREEYASRQKTVDMMEQLVKQLDRNHERDLKLEASFKAQDELRKKIEELTAEIGARRAAIPVAAAEADVTRTGAAAAEAHETRAKLLKRQEELQTKGKLPASEVAEMGRVGTELGGRYSEPVVVALDAAFKASNGQLMRVLEDQKKVQDQIADMRKRFDNVHH